MRETAAAISNERKFLRNGWYVAGYLEEIEAAPLLGRVILSEPVLLYRDEDGRPRAIGNRCPHRFAPLDRGKLEGGVVRCGYHGLGFDRTGACVHNPHGPIGTLKVPAYPLEERGGLLWIWMGKPEAADPGLISPFDQFDEQKSYSRCGYLHGRANYELMTDNILDLSHIEFLHPALGTEAVSRAKVEVAQEGETVKTSRRMVDEILPAGLARIYKAGTQRVNRTMAVDWHAPANLVLRVTIDPTDPAQTWRTGSQTWHLFTPETPDSTHYFYVGILPRISADTEIADAFVAALGRAFTTEDKPMIDCQAEMIGQRDIMSLKPALLPIDRAPVAARRILAKMIAAEAGSSEGATGE